MAEGKKVEMDLSLKDTFSSAIKTAEAEVKKLENSFKGVKDSLVSMGSKLIETFSISEVVDFAKSSIDAFNKYSQAEEGLSRVLIATGGVSGQTQQSLAKLADQISDTTLFTKAQVMQTEQFLLINTSLKGSIYNEALPAVADLATYLNIDLSQAALKVAKALAEPVKGVKELRLEGISLTDQQMNTISALEKSGNKAAEQTAILNLLQKATHGAAVAAAEAGSGPFQMLSKKFDDVKIEVGKFIMQFVQIDKLKQIVAPLNDLMQPIVQSFQKLFGRVTANGILDGLKGIMEFLRPLFKVLGDLEAKFVGAFGKIKDAIMEWKEPLQKVFGFLRDVLIWVLGLLGEVFSFIGRFLARVIDIAHTMFIVLDKLGVFKLLGKIFDGLIWALKKIGEALKWIWDHTLGKILNGLSWAYNKFKSFLGINSSDDSSSPDTSSDNPSTDSQGNPDTSKNSSLITPFADKPETSSISVSNLNSPVSDVQGAKPTNINIVINGGLVGRMEIITGKIEESYSKIKEHVTMALMEAVNDTNVIAGQ